MRNLTCILILVGLMHTAQAQTSDGTAAFNALNYSGCTTSPEVRHHTRTEPLTINYEAILNEHAPLWAAFRKKNYDNIENESSYSITATIYEQVADGILCYRGGTFSGAYNDDNDQYRTSGSLPTFLSFTESSMTLQYGVGGNYAGRLVKYLGLHNSVISVTITLSYVINEGTDDEESKTLSMYNHIIYLGNDASSFIDRSHTHDAAEHSHAVPVHVHGADGGVRSGLRVAQRHANTDVVQLSPNPAADIVNIVANQGFTYTILNAAGVQVRLGAVQRGSNKVDVKALAAGVYLFIFQNEDTTETHRVYKK